MATQQQYVDPKVVENALKNPGYYKYNDSPTQTVDQFSSTATPPSTTNSSAIAADTLGTASAIKVPTPSTDASEADALVAATDSAVKSFEDYYKEVNQQTETQKRAEGFSNDLLSLLPQTEGKGAYQAQQDEKFGVNDYTDQIRKLSKEVTSDIASYNQQITAAETASGETPLAIVRGRQAVIQRNAAATIGLKNARLLSLQGDLEGARAAADRAVNIKYGPIEEKIDILGKQLEAIQPILNADEKKVAEALKRQYEEEKIRVAEEKAKVKNNLDLAFSANVQTEFANKNGEWFRTSDGKSYSKPEDLFKDANVSSFDQLYKTGRVTDLTPERIADIEFVQQARAKYPDAGITINDTPESAQAKLQNSRLYRKDTYIAPSPNTGTTIPGIGNLTNQQLDNINPLVTGFQNNEQVKSYNVVSEQLNFLKSLGNSPTDDQARIYSFAKVMDPNSTVREGEYKTVQDYSTALVQRFGLQSKRVFTNSGLLTDEARKFITDTLTKRQTSFDTTYKNVYNETARRIELVGGLPQGTGTQFLTNFGGAYSTPTTSTPGNYSTTAPDGKTYYFHTEAQLKQFIDAIMKQK